MKEARRQQLEEDREEEQNYLDQTWMWIDDDWYTKGFGLHFIAPVDLTDDDRKGRARKAVAFRRVALRTLIEVCKYIRLVNLFFPYLPRVFLENWDNFCSSKLQLCQIDLESVFENWDRSNSCVKTTALSADLDW